MEDPIQSEIIKCEPFDVGVAPEPDAILPDGFCCDSRRKEEIILPDVNVQSVILMETTLKPESGEKLANDDGDDDIAEIDCSFMEIEEVKNMSELLPTGNAIDHKLSSGHVGMFEFVGLQTSSDEEDSIKEVASEKLMIGKMRENFVKALCVTSSNISNLLDPKPVVGNELVSHMKTAITTIIAREENSDEESDGEDALQLGPNLYFCEKCCKYFSLKSSLKRHSLTHLLKYTCSACNMSFQRKNSLKNHIRHTVCGMPFKCDTCGLAFKFKSKLARHRKAHVSGEFWCTGCSKPFKYEQYFLEHKSVCQDNLSKCMICRKTFSCAEALKAHVEVHVNSERPFGCDACGKRFMSESFYRRHTMILCGKVVNKCETCGKVCEDLDQLQLHLLTHQAVNVYTCERCSMTFKDRNALKMHAQKYINEDGYKCECCHKLFLFRSELLTHKMRHSSYRTFNCNRCCASFAYEGSLQAHMILHSLEPLICGKCGMKFETESDLKKHKLTHFKFFSCQYCEKIFYEENAFRMHLHAHSEGRFLVCNVCGKKFKNKSILASHIILHELKRKFICSVCSRTFKYAANLRRHMFLVHNQVDDG